MLQASSTPAELTSSAEAESLPILAAKATKRALERATAHECNPFLRELQVSLRKKKMRVLEHRISEDADGVRGHEFSEIAYVDKAEFVKVMNKAFRACFELGAAGARVFWLVMEQLGENQEKDVVFLSHRKKFIVSGSEVALAKSTFYDGLKQLTNAGFIAPAAMGPGFYWINPDRFFNGNRATFVQQYRVKSKPFGAPQPKLTYPAQRGGAYCSTGE